MKVTVLNRAYNYKLVSVKTNVNKIVIESTDVLLHYDDETVESFDSDKYCIDVE